MSDVGTDYTLTAEDADALKAVVLLPGDIRAQLLKKYLAERGTAALVNLFCQVIGMANSVVANNREMIELAGIISGELHPHNAHQINLPTLFGALSGVTLAASVDQTKTCNGCAYRLGAIANQSPVTTYDAEWCGQDGNQDFLCHERLDAKGNPRHLCAGNAKRKKQRAGRVAA